MNTQRYAYSEPTFYLSIIRYDPDIIRWFFYDIVFFIKMAFDRSGNFKRHVWYRKFKINFNILEPNENVTNFKMSILNII